MRPFGLIPFLSAKIQKLIDTAFHVATIIPFDTRTPTKL